MQNLKLKYIQRTNSVNNTNLRTLFTYTLLEHRTMKMNGQIISREYVKPSSPTPSEHKIHKLSLLDQIVPPIYVPLVLYYPNLHHKNENDDFVSETTQLLKQSLSSTLTGFYPLAGRVGDNLSVDCDDGGVLFIVMSFDVCLPDHLRNSDPVTCREHIPSELTWTEPGPGSRIAMIQVNFFECGGVAIGALFLHKVVDGASIGIFMKSWSATARGCEEVVFPSYKGKAIFHQNESMTRENHLFSAMRRYFKFGKTVMRRYVFDGSAVSKLRAEIDPNNTLKRRPTRVETVSAFLWKYFTIAAAAARKSGSIENKHSFKSLVTHGVNMRRKSDPPFSDHSFGNFVWLVPAPAVTHSGDAEVEMKTLFAKVRAAIDGVDTDFVKRMQGEDGFSGYCDNVEASWSEFPEGADYLAISSWCNFGLYGVDFGLEKPVWITKCDGGSEVEWPFINVLWLMDTKEGDGIEAWLTMEENYFAEFDKIQEIRDLARVDPNPLA